VEVYLGVKMKYDDMKEDESQRFRDLNLSICADGKTPKSGYTVQRATHIDGNKVTLLLRNGVEVARSTKAEDLLPPWKTGHRQWFAIRMEKRGAELRVYLDNHLSFTYTDPEPLPGGYVAVWTKDNGIMLGRANLSAEHMIITDGLPLTAPVKE